MAYEMKSMLELMNEALAKTEVSYKSVEQFITKGDASQAFIDHMMNLNTAHFPSKNPKIYRYSQERARHIAATFLVGMIFAEFGGFYKSLPSVLNCNNWDEDKKASLAQRMWLITSLSHDNGYRRKKLLANEHLVFEDEFPHFLLTDKYENKSLQSAAGFRDHYPQVFAHEYNQILDYNRYVRKYHREWAAYDEANDHGILGGVEKFNDLVGIMLRQDSDNMDQELPLIKACCLTVAQHNIFKSSKQKYDKRYEEFHLNHLLSTTDFRITEETPLLLFLCLVDTIECMKRFSQGATNGKFLEAPTILRKTMVYVDEQKIILNFSELKNHIDRKLGNKKSNNKVEMKAKIKGKYEAKDLDTIYDNYLSGLQSFENWTVFKGEVDPNNANIITITLNK